MFFNNNTINVKDRSLEYCFNDISIYYALHLSFSDEKKRVLLLGSFEHFSL